MPKINKTERLNQLTDDYMQAVGELFTKDEDAEKEFAKVILQPEEIKAIQMLNLDSLTKLVLASIFGCL